MSSFRSNLLFSTIALVLMGLVRPGFNIAISRLFGPEVNGHATALLSVAFLAALLPTAGLPSVLLVHVSRSIGEGRAERARAFARFCTLLGLGLALLAGLAAAMASHLGHGPRAAPIEAVLVVLAVIVYSHARFARNALLANGLAAFSVRADLFGVLSMLVALGVLLATRRSDLALVFYASPYLTYSLVTLPRLVSELRGGELDARDRREVLRYAVLWFIATAASLATSELAVLVLHERVSESLLGQFGVVVSLLTPLGLAPRVLETPLLHELSQGAGRGDEARQRALTGRALHWLSVLTTPMSTAVAILSGPILFIAARIETPEIVDAFAMMVLSFSLEITQMPASNLVAARARPWMPPILSVVPLLITCVVWAAHPTGGPFAVALGLTTTHLVKGLSLLGFVRVAYGVPVFAERGRRTIALVVAIGATLVARRGLVSPWLVVVVFELFFLALFWRTLVEIARELVPERYRGRLLLGPR